MFMSVAVYLSQIRFFSDMSLHFSDIRRIRPGAASISMADKRTAAERGMELFEPADSPKCARTAREEENPRWRVEPQQIGNNREMY